MSSIKGMVRSDDGSTSCSAASSVAKNRNKIQEAVLEAFRNHGNMNDETLENLPEFKLCGYAYSTVRKRRSELCQSGVLVSVGVNRNSHNSKMNVWGITQEVQLGNAVAPNSI